MHSSTIRQSERPFHELPDDELLDLVGAGAPAALPAMQEVERRHGEAVDRLARLCASDPAAAEQLGTQVFAQVKRLACSRDIPRANFRLFLLSLVLRLAAEWTTDTRCRRLGPEFTEYAQTTPDAVLLYPSSQQGSRSTLS
ncbi:hypothetical protein ABZS63_08680, partial [Streptomyces sp. NPDC005568]